MSMYSPVALGKELEKYSKRELCEIYSNVNRWKWDERLGEKPERFDDLPKYNIHWWHKLAKRKTKADYLDPILYTIQCMLGHEEYLHWLHVETEKTMTEEEFQQFWKRHEKICRSLTLWW